MSEAAERLRRAKRTIREDVLATRDALSPAERAAKSEAIASRLLGLSEIVDAERVMAFSSFGSEVETAPLLDGLAAAGATVALPRIEGRDLVAVETAPGDPMSETWFGGREPAAGRVLDASTLDLVVVPGVAFDRTGRRIGYGLGFYDRFLARLRPDAPKVAVAFALQVLHEVPAGHADRRVDAIVTEEEVIRCA